MPFQKIALETFAASRFVTLKDDWALVSAGTEQEFNTMTIGWGTIGCMWHKPVVTVFIRPQRYTKEYLDSHDTFTVSFFPKEYRKALEILGAISGRDGDKITKSALTPFFIDGTVTFEEAHTVILCRKLYGGQQLDASKFTDPGLDTKYYPDKDYSFIYFGEIIKVFQS